MATNKTQVGYPTIILLPKTFRNVILKTPESYADLKDRNDIIFVDKEEWSRIEELTWQLLSKN